MYVDEKNDGDKVRNPNCIQGSGQVAPLKIIGKLELISSCVPSLITEDEMRGLLASCEGH